jgi:hypothetical protein
MKIRFKTFSKDFGRRCFEFDTDSIKNGGVLDKFLLNVDDDGEIYIVPMIREGSLEKVCMYYPLNRLTKVPEI